MRRKEERRIHPIQNSRLLFPSEQILVQLCVFPVTKNHIDETWSMKDDFFMED